MVSTVIRTLKGKLLDTSSILVTSTIFLFFAIPSNAIEVKVKVDDDGNVEARAGWSPPTYGTPVDHYVLQHSINDGPWYYYASAIEDTTLKMTISFIDNHRVRVAGVDAENRQGPFSLPSNYYCPADSFPQQPGQPIRE